MTHLWKDSSQAILCLAKAATEQYTEKELFKVKENQVKGEHRTEC